MNARRWQRDGGIRASASHHGASYRARIMALMTGTQIVKGGGCKSENSKSSKAGGLSLHFSNGMDCEVVRSDTVDYRVGPGIKLLWGRLVQDVLVV